jgi:hypothetical protein
MAILFPMVLSSPPPENHTTEVVYQRDGDVVDAQEEPLPWSVGTPIQIFENSRVVCKAGPICCQMLRYTYEPGHGGINEDTAESASR